MIGHTMLTNVLTGVNNTLNRMGDAMVKAITFQNQAQANKDKNFKRQLRAMHGIPIGSIDEMVNDIYNTVNSKE